MGYSPWAWKELYTTEWLSTQTHTHTHTQAHTHRHTHTHTQSFRAFFPFSISKSGPGSYIAFSCHFSLDSLCCNSSSTFLFMSLCYSENRGQLFYRLFPSLSFSDVSSWKTSGYASPVSKLCKCSYVLLRISHQGALRSVSPFLIIEISITRSRYF